MPKNPHAFLITIFSSPAFAPIALSAQEQVAAFFTSGGAITVHPEPRRFFEVPVVLPLPEDLNYIP